MPAAWPNATLVHLPVHALWLNQIEVVFSVIQRKVIQRKVIRPADFADLGELAHRLERFEARYTGTAITFDWRFTTADLAGLLERFDTHQTNVTDGLLAA